MRLAANHRKILALNKKTKFDRTMDKVNVLKQRLEQVRADDSQDDLPTAQIVVDVLKKP